MVPGRVSGGDDFSITRVVIGERFHFRQRLRILPRKKFNRGELERTNLRLCHFKNGRFSWDLKAV